MSKENHPNFHALKFTSDIVRSFFESLRGKADKNSLAEEAWNNIKYKIIDFVSEIETIVDEGIKK